MKEQRSVWKGTTLWAMTTMLAMLACVIALGLLPPQALAEVPQDEGTMLAEDDEPSTAGTPAPGAQIQTADDEQMPTEEGSTDAAATAGMADAPDEAMADLDEARRTSKDETDPSAEGPSAAETESDATLNVQDADLWYSVLFDPNGGTGIMEPMTDCEAGAVYDLPQCEFAREGYDFAGWNTQADGSGASYADAGEVSRDAADAGVDLTLYAQWSATRYAIAYKLDGGTNNAKNPAQYTVETETFVLATPTKRGYAFVAWYADAQFATKVTRIAKGSTGNRTLYAKWTANKYGIAFKANGGSGTTAALSGCAYDANVTLTANGFTRKGYKFASWNTKANGSGTRYANKATVRNLSATDGATVTLYAQWTPVTYKLTYKLSGGKNSAKNPATYTVTTATITLASPTRKGYKFGGWFSDAKYTKRIEAIAKGSTGNRTLYAKWTAIKYRITYKLGGGKNSAKNPKKYAVTTATIKLANPTRKGYKFGGWFSDAKYTKRVKTIAKGSTGNKTLYAKWTAIKYKITYKLGGGANSAKNPKTYTIASKKIVLAKPTRTGYRFQGWFSDAKCTKRVKAIAKGSTGNRTLYAKWAVNTYKIVYNGNGATSGSMASQTGLKYGKAYKLSANKFSRGRMIFAGWNTRADGMGTSYVSGATVRNLTSTHNGTVTLYAQWEDLVACKALGFYDYGGVVTVKNNYTQSVKGDVTFLYYNGSTLAKTSHAYFYCLEPGHTCALDGWSMDAENYTSWTYSLSWEPASDSTIGNASYISYSSNWGDDNVVVSVRNNGYSNNFTTVAVVFYKNGRVVGYTERFADVTTPGSTDYLEFSYPYTSDYKTIYPDSYKVYVNESYGYDWSI